MGAYEIDSTGTLIAQNSDIITRDLGHGGSASFAGINGFNTMSRFNPVDKEDIKDKAMSDLKYAVDTYAESYPTINKVNIEWPEADKLTDDTQRRALLSVIRRFDQELKGYFQRAGKFADVTYSSHDASNCHAGLTRLKKGGGMTRSAASTSPLAYADWLFGYQRSSRDPSRVSVKHRSSAGSGRRKYYRPGDRSSSTW